MPAEELRAAVILGSTREGRFGPTVSRWFVDLASGRDDMTLDVIDLATAGLPDVLGGEAAPSVARMGRRLAEADAFVVVTPEYNHSFPAPLKNAIDWFRVEWRAKPVGFVSYGGKSGGIRAVEQLRLVFAELHAVTMRDEVSIHGAWAEFGPEGRPKDPDRMAKSAGAMLGQLSWWGEALRSARARRPYPA